MRKLWFVAVVMIVFILLPSGYTIHSPTEDIELVEIAQPAAEHLPRVYAENLAREVYNSINLTKYRDLVIEFTENGSRYIMTYADIGRGHNEDSRNWLVQQMDSLSNGRLEITLEGTFMNIEATLPGYLPGEDLPIFVISAHYDSNSGSPGANTDGSGVAVILELVRVMSLYEWPLDIVFLVFNGEHAIGGNLGSNEMSNQYVLSGVDILAMYNVDTIMRQNRYAPPDERLILAYNTGAEYWGHLAKAVDNYYGGDIVTFVSSVDFPLWGASGHKPFADKGIQNVLFAFESGYMYDSVSGTASDLWDRREFNYYIGRETSGFIGASLAFTMARGYGHLAQFVDVRTILAGRSEVFYIPLSAPTTINVTCRWYGGGANFTLFDSDDNLLTSEVFTSASPWEPTPVMNLSVSVPGCYKLFIHNPEDDASIGVDLYIQYDSDVDKNGIPDSEEYWLDSALFEADTDLDTISDALEIIYGLDINSPDSDADDMPDSWELKVGLDPRNPLDAFEDPDLDNLTNLVEYNHGLNPFSSDTDQDKMSDSWELDNGLNPLIDDADENPDGDQYTNYEEYMLGTDPNVAEVQDQPMIIMWIAAPSAAVILLAVGVYLIRRE
ncbi:MAG: M28 family peptidase [Candidatus Thorarchaeota archaeon]